MQTKGKFILMTVEEFGPWLEKSRFNRVIKLVQNHHTYLPCYEQFTESNHFSLLAGMERAHLERGFNQIAQNLTIFPDGLVAICRPFDLIPAGIKGANKTGICIENIGNFDQGRDLMREEHKRAIVEVNAALCGKFRLSPDTESIVYHHWYDLSTGERTNGTGTTKTCPGTAFFGGNTVGIASRDFIPLVAASLPRYGGQEPGIASIGSAEVVASPSLNVRDAPGIEGAIVKVLQPGIMVHIYEEQHGWCRIEPTVQDWVAKKYLELWDPVTAPGK